MFVWPIDDQLSHLLNIVLGHLLWIGQDLGNVNGDADLVNLKVRVWRYDCSAGEINSLAGQIASKSSL